MFLRNVSVFNVTAKYLSTFRISDVSSFLRNVVYITRCSTISTKSYYSVLGVKPDATDEEIKNAYYAMSKKYHPDLNVGDKNSETKILEINEAFEVLGDKLEKEKYDSKMFPKVWERKPFIYDHEATAKPQKYIFRRVFKEMAHTPEQYHKHTKGELKRKRRHAVQKIMFHKYQNSKKVSSTFHKPY